MIRLADAKAGIGSWIGFYNLSLILKEAASGNF